VARDRDLLLSLIREKLTSGRLPRTECTRTWFGPGLGSACQACDLAIFPDEFEAECDQADGTSIRFHRECFMIWDAERRAPPPG
jgi:hypothetical protein